MLFNGLLCLYIKYWKNSSGKTYTAGINIDQQNTPETYGLAPRIIKKLLESVDEANHAEKHHTITYTLSLGYIEIYMETIQDLLAQQERLKVKLNNECGGFEASGMKEKVITRIEEAYRILRDGFKNRTTSDTAMNDVSSRSHALLYCIVRQKAVSTDELGHVTTEERTSRFILADLAGSETAEATQGKGEKARAEGSNINQSLSTLRRVFEKITQPGLKELPPYRESILTMLLKLCIGGESKTVFIACIHTGSDEKYRSATDSTLKYAHMAKTIVNKPKAALSVRSFEKLEAENMELKKELQLRTNKYEGLKSGFRTVLYTFKQLDPNNILSPIASPNIQAGRETSNITSTPSVQRGALFPSQTNDQDGMDEENQENIPPTHTITFTSPDSSSSSSALPIRSPFSSPKHVTSSVTSSSAVKGAGNGHYKFIMSPAVERDMLYAEKQLKKLAETLKKPLVDSNNTQSTTTPTSDTDSVKQVMYMRQQLQEQNQYVERLSHDLHLERRRCEEIKASIEHAESEKYQRELQIEADIHHKCVMELELQLQRKQALYCQQVDAWNNMIEQYRAEKEQIESEAGKAIQELREQAASLELALEEHEELEDKLYDLIDAREEDIIHLEEIVDQYVDEKDEMNDEIEELKQQAEQSIKQHEDEKSALLQQLQQVQQEFENTRLQYENKEHEYNTLHRQFAAVNRQNTQLNTELEVTRKACEEKECDIEKLREEVQQHIHTAEQRECVIHDLQSQLLSLRIECKEKEGKASGAESDVVLLRHEVKQLHDAYIEAQQVYKAEQQCVSQLMCNLNDMGNEYEAYQQKYSMVMCEVEQKCDSLMRELDTTKCELQCVEEKYATSMRQIGAMSVALKVIHEKYEHEVQNVADLQHELTVRVDAYKSLEHEYQHTTEQYSQSSTTLLMIENDYNELTSQHMQLDDDVKKLRIECNTVTMNLATAENEYSVLKAELASKAAEIVRMDALNHAMAQQISEFQRQETQYTKEILDLSNKYNEVFHENAANEKKVASQSEEINRLSNEYQEILKRKNEVERKLLELVRNYSSLEQELNQSKTTILDQCSRINELMIEKHTLDERMNDSQREWTSRISAVNQQCRDAQYEAERKNISIKEALDLAAQESQHKKELEASLDKLCHELQDTRTEKATLIRQNSKLEEELESVKHSKSKIHEIANNLAQQLKNTQKEVREMSTQYSVKVEEMNQLTTDMELLFNEKKQCHQELEHQKAQHLSAVKQLQNQIIEYQQTIDTLKVQLSDKELLITEKRSQLTSSEDTIHQVQRKLSGMTQEKDECMIQVVTLQHQIQDLQSTAESLESSIEKLKGEKQQYKQQLSDVTTLNQKQLADLKCLTDKYEQEIRVKESALEQLHRSNHRLQAEKEDVQQHSIRKTKELETQIFDLTEIINTKIYDNPLESKLKQCEVELASSKQLLSEAQSQMQHDAQELDALSETVAYYEREMEGLKEQIHTLRFDVSELSHEKSKLRSSVAELELRNSGLNQKVLELKERKECFKKQFKEEKNECEGMRKILDSMVDGVQAVIRNQPSYVNVTGTSVANVSTYSDYMYNSSASNANALNNSLIFPLKAIASNHGSSMIVGKRDGRGGNGLGRYGYGYARPHQIRRGSVPIVELNSSVSDESHGLTVTRQSMPLTGTADSRLNIGRNAQAAAVHSNMTSNTNNSVGMAAYCTIM